MYQYKADQSISAIVLHTLHAYWDYIRNNAISRQNHRFHVKMYTEDSDLEWHKIRTAFQYPIGRLIVRSREVSKPRYLYLYLSDGSEIWQAQRQQCCRYACQISKQCDNLNCQSPGFEDSRDLAIKRLIEYWNRTQLRWYSALGADASERPGRCCLTVIVGCFECLNYASWINGYISEKCI